MILFYIFGALFFSVISFFMIMDGRKNHFLSEEIVFPVVLTAVFAYFVFSTSIS